LNILEINLAKRWGGAEINVLHLCETLQRLGHKVYLGALKNGMLMKKAQKSGVNVLPITYTNQLDIISIGTLLKYIKKFSIQIINSHVSRDSFIAGISGKLSGVPTILTKRTCFPVGSHLFNKLLYFHLVDKIIAISGAIRDNIIRSVNVDRKKIEVIYSGVRIEDFYDEDKFKKWSNSLTSSKEFVIAAVSRLDEIKRIDVFIKAAAIICKSMPNVKFLVVGHDEKNIRHGLEKLADSLGVGDKVTFTGFIDNVKPVLYGIDIFVICSVSEGLGRGVTEAMSTGRPVVATNVGGLLEVVEDGVTGILVSPNNPEILSEKIMFLLKSPEILKNMGRNALRCVREKFNINKIAEETVSVYEEMIRCRKKFLLW
jgi:glycosyltransferase involved in cell wall biosynthesis